MWRLCLARSPAAAASPAASAAAPVAGGRSGWPVCSVCSAVARGQPQHRHRRQQQADAKRHLTTLAVCTTTKSTTAPIAAARWSGRTRNDYCLAVGSFFATPANGAKALFRPPRSHVSGWGRSNLSSTAASPRGALGHGDQSLNRRGRSSASISTTSSTSSIPPAPGSGREPASVPFLDRLVAPVRHVQMAFLSQDGIPTEESTLAALRTCEKAASMLRDAPSAPQPGSVDSQAALLSMDADATSATGGSSSSGGSGGAGSSPGAVATPSPSHPSNSRGSAQSVLQGSTQSSDPARSRARLSSAAAFSGGGDRDLEWAIDTISEAAYAIISHPPVLVTPQILYRYVAIQSRLGRPESLPSVLSMYTSKPVARADKGGSISYVKPNPNRAANAVDAALAEAALDVAIEARNLDAAVAIVEHTYATTAYGRSKLIKKGLMPATVAAAVPGMIYVLASNLSHLQNTMDESKATVVAFGAIAAYLGFTAIIGAVASGTGNDQMKRVTWIPGTSLTRRWIREDERAALDRIACSFGFREATRFGEEEGAEFLALREYILRKGMILDRVELMDGMVG